jgi:hypothetical protein
MIHINSSSDWKMERFNVTIFGIKRMAECGERMEAKQCWTCSGKRGLVRAKAGWPVLVQIGLCR